MSRHLHRCFASTGTMFLWALFLVALTATYFSVHYFVDTSSRYFAASWGGLHWERQIRASASPRRPPGSAEGAGLSVLVTGAAGFVGMHCSLALRRRGDGVVGLDNFKTGTTTRRSRRRAGAWRRWTRPAGAPAPAARNAGRPRTGFTTSGTRRR
jgi:UDP-glucuronate 4-epimerase